MIIIVIGFTVILANTRKVCACLGYNTLQRFAPGLRSRQKGKVLTFHPRAGPRGYSMTWHAKWNSME